ncbi:MAG: translation initiation factor [Bacteriovoracaceae bacterium]|jgi:translation initiation factor 1|nr:translation initiation factor [Bacteriovoracaceae bacterium]
MAKLIKSEEVNIIYSCDGSHLDKKKDLPRDKDLNPSDYTLKIELQKNKRGGKTVSVIKDLPFNPKYFQKLTKKLKNAMGSGGSFKNDSIEIQGDHRGKMKTFLENLGFKVKLSGG